jgi:hypothetical protein
MNTMREFKTNRSPAHEVFLFWDFRHASCRSRDRALEMDAAIPRRQNSLRIKAFAVSSPTGELQSKLEEADPGFNAASRFIALEEARVEIAIDCLDARHSCEVEYPFPIVASQSGTAFP